MLNFEVSAKIFLGTFIQTGPLLGDIAVLKALLNSFWNFFYISDCPGFFCDRFK